MGPETRCAHLHQRRRIHGAGRDKRDGDPARSIFRTVRGAFRQDGRPYHGIRIPVSRAQWASPQDPVAQHKHAHAGYWQSCQHRRALIWPLSERSLRMVRQPTRKPIPRGRLNTLLATCAILLLVVLLPTTAKAICRHCGSSAFGSGCPHSPYGKHEHRSDLGHCEFCNSTAYGSGCPHSPTGKHRHGPGENKCIWCESTAYGSGCPHNPTTKHEK